MKMCMTPETMDRFAAAARELCALRGVDPDARVFSRDGVAMPKGPTNETLVAGELYSQAQMNLVMQKHRIDHFTWER